MKRGPKPLRLSDEYANALAEVLALRKTEAEIMKEEHARNMKRILKDKNPCSPKDYSEMDFESLITRQAAASIMFGSLTEQLNEKASYFTYLDANNVGQFYYEKEKAARNYVLWRKELEAVQKEIRRRLASM